jgi:hypothetical protein
MDVWVVGAGYFGAKAVRCLAQKDSDIKITLIDIDPKRLCIRNPSVTPIQDDGVHYLAQHLIIGSSPDWIVAALPIHLVFEWIRKTLKGLELKAIPLSDSQIAELPNPVRGPGGALYLSRADFLCPETCTEPPGRCTVTGQPREIEMYRLIESMQTASCRCVIVRSHQLLPGVGGYSPKSLLSAREIVRNCRGAVLIGTACSCHGVVHQVYVSDSKDITSAL